jgi:hypothetical protein
MMRKVILILCLQLAVITAYAGGNDHGMNGRVKKVTEKTHFASEGPLSHGESLDLGTTYIRSYDEQGRLTEEIKGEAFRTPGTGKEIKSENRKIYSYNDKGWLYKIACMNMCMMSMADVCWRYSAGERIRSMIVKQCM